MLHKLAAKPSSTDIMLSLQRSDPNEWYSILFTVFGVSVGQRWGVTAMRVSV